MSERRVVQFRVSPILLRQALGLPETANITGARWSFDYEELILYAEDETLPVLPYGAVPMVVKPTITRTLTADGVASHWNWNAGTDPR